MDMDLTEACSRTLPRCKIVEKNDDEREISSSYMNSNLICTTSEMLSESMSCLNDDSRHDSFPHSPDSAELSTISLPNCEPHDIILNEPMPPRPSSEGDQPSSTSTKSFKCSKCPYETDRKNNLKRHMTTMHDPAPSSLDCCGTRFATKGDLRDHTRAAHGAGYTCWQCGHTFCRRALLQRHQSVHSGHKAFSCSKCGYQSSHKSNMQRHMQVHLHSKSSATPCFKDRLKNNGKGIFRSPSWKYSNGLSRQNHGAIEKNSTANNLKGLLEQQSGRPASTHHESKVPTVKLKQSMLMNQNSFYSRLDHGQFSKALSDMAAANLSATLRNHDSEKKCVSDPYPVSQSTTNSANSFSPGIWRLAFGQQNKPMEIDHPHLKTIQARSPDPNHSVQITGCGIHKVKSKLALPEFCLSPSYHPASKISAQDSTRCNYEPRSLSNIITGDIELSRTHSRTQGTSSLCRSSEGHSAFVVVGPTGRRIHRPIPRYCNQALDISIDKFLPSIPSVHQFTGGKGIEIHAQTDDASGKDDCQLETAMRFQFPRASGERQRRSNTAPSDFSSIQNAAHSNTICVAPTRDSVVGHQHLSPHFRIERPRSNLTFRDSLRNNLIPDFAAEELPLQDDSTSPIEPIDYSMQKKAACSNSPRDKQIQMENAGKMDLSGHSVCPETEASCCSTRSQIPNSNSTASPLLRCEVAPVAVSECCLLSSTMNLEQNEAGNSNEPCRTSHLHHKCALANDCQTLMSHSSYSGPDVFSVSGYSQEYIPKKLRASRKKKVLE